MTPAAEILLTVTGGYLVGSFLPAYFIARRLKGIDIRAVGRGHAGASNVYLYVSPLAGIITGAIDLLKGVAAVLCSLHLLHAPLAVAYLGGFAAIAGHVYPFYLGFKGGRGAATATGILILSLLWLMLPDPLYFAPEILMLVLVIVSTIIITRNDYLLALVVLPLLAYFLLVKYYPRPEACVAVLIMGFNFWISLVQFLHKNSISLSPQANPVLWSTLIKIAILTFLLLSFQFPEQSPPLSVIIAMLLFVFLDTVRLRYTRQGKHGEGSLIKKIADFFYLENGAARFSAATLFFLVAVIIMLFFRHHLALAAVSFLIVGDAVEKIIEPRYGQHVFLSGSLEGFLGHFTACCVMGYILHSYLGLAVTVLLVGAFTASLVESLPLKKFNKLIVPLASTLAMFFYSGERIFRF